MKNIRESSPILNELVTSGEIALVGAMYDVETGKVTFYEKSLVDSKFTPVQILQD
ncbi:hypothetical protein D3C78_1677270 [compost metagenome]